MIGVENQYIFKYSIGDKNDFLQEDDLKTFLLVEESGNVLPTFDMTFSCKDPDILKYLNEGNELKVSFGKYKDKMIDTPFRISRLVPTRCSESEYMISITGIYSALPYIAEDRIQIYSGSGVEVINEVVSRYFKTDFNISASTDSQNWIQGNVPDKKFINDVWMHSYLGDSFIGVGISANGRFILKDMKRHAATAYKYKFTHTPTEEKDISYDGDYVVDDTSGFLNHWLGYGREKHLYNLEDGTESTMLENTSRMLALTKTLSRTSAISKRHAEAGLLTDNVHDNYWKAFYRNLQHLAVFNSTKLTFSFHNRFEPIQVLDLVMFMERELDKVGASEWYSGKYFVNKVARSVSNRQFCTTVQLCRESLSGIKGDLR